MNTVKVISRILFYITRFLAIVYFAIAIYSVITLITGWSLIFKDDGKYFQICFPFTKTPFLLGDYNLSYIILEFLQPLSFYGFFFLLLSNVFKVFFQPKLFTVYGIKHLRRFYMANLIIPGIAVFITSIFVKVDNEISILIFLHFTLGVFAYFLAAIFKQGLNLQTEQDLII